MTLIKESEGIYCDFSRQRVTAKTLEVRMGDPMRGRGASGCCFGGSGPSWLTVINVAASCMHMRGRARDYPFGAAHQVHATRRHARPDQPECLRSTPPSNQRLSRTAWMDAQATQPSCCSVRIAPNRLRRRLLLPRAQPPTPHPST